MRVRGGQLPPEIRREYRRARNLGGVMDVILPLALAVTAVLLAEPELISEIESTGEFSLLRYGLVAFSVTIAIAARIILGRMMVVMMDLVARGRHVPGRVSSVYLVVYALYLVPAVWGFTYFFLAGGLLAFLCMVLVTVLAYLFLTPRPDYFARGR